MFSAIEPTREVIFPIRELGIAVRFERSAWVRIRGPKVLVRKADSSEDIETDVRASYSLSQIAKKISMKCLLVLKVIVLQHTSIIDQYIYRRIPNRSLKSLDRLFRRHI